MSVDCHEHLPEAISERCSLSSLKEPVKVHCKKACPVMEQTYEYQHSGDIFVKNIFKPFHDTGLFLYFLKYIRKREVS